MYIRFLAVLIFGSFVVTYADSAVQTDWSGGSGILGPVTDWNDQFYLDACIEWSSSAGSITLKKPAEYTVDGNFDGAYSVFSEDIDGDGDMDIIGAASNSDDIVWWENIDGSGTSWTGHTVAGNFDGARSVYSADINGDGDMDIIGAASIADDITWWENIDGSGTSWTEYTLFGEFDGAWSVCSGDIDGDSDMDIIGAAKTDNDIIWWENEDGLGTSWAERLVDKDFWGVYSVYLEDIDGDGDMDVLGAAYGGCDITWWENTNGSGTSWAKNNIEGNFYGAISVYSEDIDGDGDMDVLGAAFNGNEITWWENTNGSGTSWAEHNIAVNYDGARSVYSEDMDGDGDMDVLGAAQSLDEITWWENTNGSGTSWAEHNIAVNFNGTKCVYSEDMDGDGDMDVLGAAFNGNEITWWDLAEYSSGGELVSSILNLGNEPDWGAIDWSVYTPSGTSVSFLVRASDDYANMGDWSDTLSAPCSLDGILNNYDSYFQYKVLIETEHPETSTPSLHDVTLSWDPLGIEGGLHVSGYALLNAEPNPSHGYLSVGIAVPEYSQVELSIYDLTGHLVITPSRVEYSPGVHQVQLGEFTPGIYFCRMISGDFSATQRLVVIE
ncbi:MAG: T9SS type A sorting domain-containing protein [Candidatus Aegiribacteria sp.]|nr:T9SS type A sorting domain-containing protein [Candidatus Aegiribacteria sp.]